VHGDQEDTSSDQLELTVDGMIFSVAYDPSQPGSCNYTRLPGVPGVPGGPGGPGGHAVDYGSSSRRSDHQRETLAAHAEGIRDFIAMVDPVTGYIKDEDDADIE
jgi:hypothetical protein